MKIDNLVLNPKVPEVKNILEWLITLKLAKLSPILGDQSKQSQIGFISGIGIERLQIEVPAVNHDDTVPNHIMAECKEFVEQRRQQLRASFQSQLPSIVEKSQN